MLSNGLTVTGDYLMEVGLKFQQRRLSLVEQQPGYLVGLAAHHLRLGQGKD